MGTSVCVCVCVYTCVHDVFAMCRGLLIDVPRHGVASVANVVYGRHYTGCVDDVKASRVLVDAADKSSTVFDT